jgi:hypothetical protein
MSSLVSESKVTLLVEEFVEKFLAGRSVIEIASISADEIASKVVPLISIIEDKVDILISTKIDAAHREKGITLKSRWWETIPEDDTTETEQRSVNELLTTRRE